MSCIAAYAARHFKCSALIRDLNGVVGAGRCDETDLVRRLPVKWPRSRVARYAVTMEELDKARYILLTTFKRDGSPVSSPVWITGSGGTYEFTTGERAWKTRRLRADPRVRVQACSMRGRVKPGSVEYSGSGEILVDAADVGRTEHALVGQVRLAIPGHPGRRPAPWRFWPSRPPDGRRHSSRSAEA